MGEEFKCPWFYYAVSDAASAANESSSLYVRYDAENAEESVNGIDLYAKAADAKDPS